MLAAGDSVEEAFGFCRTCIKMTEFNTNQPDVTARIEKAETFKSLKFEPARHQLLDQNLGSIESIKNGDLNHFAWNNEVLKRIGSYGPRVLGIDSLSPVHFKPDQPSATDYTLDEKAYVWWALPGSPTDINDKNEVLVIAGDVIMHHFKPDNHDRIRENLDKIDKDLTQDSFNKDLIDTAITGAAGAALSIIAYSAGKRLREDVSKENQPKKFSRRKFLKLAGSTIGLGTIAFLYGRWAAPNFAAQSTFEGMESFFEKVTQITKSRIIPNDWVDGRTGLVIAKTLEASSQQLTPSDSNAAVIMGSRHLAEANAFIADSEKRGKAIKKAVSGLWGVIEDIAPMKPEIDREDLLKDFKQYISSADLLLVNDSRNETFNNSDVLNESVHFVGNYQSQEVLEAINDIVG